MQEAAAGEWHGPEMEAIRPILEVQERWSHIPDADELLIERVKTREGHHLFFFPFEGRLVHEGLAALLAWRAVTGWARVERALRRGERLPAPRALAWLAGGVILLGALTLALTILELLRR